MKIEIDFEQFGMMICKDIPYNLNCDKHKGCMKCITQYLDNKNIKYKIINE